MITTQPPLPTRPDDRAVAPTGAAPHPPRWAGALSGLVAALAALGVGELVAGILQGTSGPVLSVGEWVVDHTPAPVKEFAIRQFGTSDKTALIIGTVAILLIAAAVIGVAATRRLWIGLAGIAAFTAIGIATAVSRPSADALSVLPSLIGGIAAGGALAVLLRAATPRPAVVRDQPSTPAALAMNRRGFFLSLGVVAGGAALAGGAGRMLRQRFDVAAARAGLRLPPPVSPAAALPKGADLGVDGITPFVTRNADFYRVDTALVVPQVSPTDWELRMHGMVERELRLSFDDLLARPMIERDITLVCVSNEVGGPYAGTARWQGVPLADLLEEVGVDPSADQLVSRSVDGWTAGTPTALVRDGRDAMVAVAMNGEPLPLEHGFPARLVVPGLYGFTSATKWLVDLELSTFADFDAYWVRRGWAREAPIKTLTRIDTPRGLARVSPGAVVIGGVAWAVHRGIAGVEVRIDGGDWMPATLGTVPSEDTWRQWTVEWDATPGSHTLEARATDGDGAMQTPDRAEPIPDGASGWHSIVVLVQG